MKDEKLIAIYQYKNGESIAEVTERSFESSEDAKEWEKETWEEGQFDSEYSPTGQWFVFSARAVPIVDDIYICVVVRCLDC